MATARGRCSCEWKQRVSARAAERCLCAEKYATWMHNLWVSKIMQHASLHDAEGQRRRRRRCHQHQPNWTVLNWTGYAFVVARWWPHTHTHTHKHTLTRSYPLNQQQQQQRWQRKQCQQFPQWDRGINDKRWPRSRRRRRRWRRCWPQSGENLSPL